MMNISEKEEGYNHRPGYIENNLRQNIVLLPDVMV